MITDAKIDQMKVRPMRYTTPVKFSSTDNFGCGPSDEDDVYTVAEFLANVRDMSFCDDDGWGHPVKDRLADESICISPTQVHRIPPDATHIVWYNQ